MRNNTCLGDCWLFEGCVFFVCCPCVVFGLFVLFDPLFTSC